MEKLNTVTAMTETVDTNQNPLLLTANVTEGDKQHDKTTNSANNIVSIDTRKVNENNINELIEKAKRVSLLEFIEKTKTKNRYACPFCGSGKGDKRTGGIMVNDDNTFHCNACSKHGDVIEFYMKEKDVDFKTAIEHLTSDKIIYKKANPVSKPKQPKPVPDFTAFINECSTKFKGSKAETYINNRGISSEVAQRFNLGYSDNIYFDNESKQALIIPVSKCFYFGRNLNPNSDNRFHNVKGGINSIFNQQALEQSETPLFVNESVIDTLSIIEVKANGIALNGVDLGLLERTLKQYNKLPTLILCLDKDKTGDSKTSELTAKLNNMGINFIDGRFILNGCKDANEALLKDRTAFTQAVNNAIEQALNTPEPQVKIKQERPCFIAVKFNKSGESYEHIDKRELTAYIRDNINYFSVVDNKDNKRRFTYINNFYIPTALHTFKNIVAEPVKQYDIKLVEAKYLDEVVKNLDYCELLKSYEDINNDCTCVNMLNGIVNIFTGEIMPHTPELFITRQLPCEWLKEVPETPTFDKYMNELTNGNEDTKHFLMEYMGCIFSNVSGTGFKQALFQTGKGNTGKSQLKLMVEKILGDNNYTSIDLKELEEDKFSISTLYNKRLAGSSDMNVEHVKSMARFKALTGGDNILIQEKFGHPFNMRYDGFLWFCTNKLPTFGGDKGEHVYDRMLILEHHNVIPKEKRDPFLIDKLLKEKNGIVMKCIITARQAIRTKKFTIPPEVKVNTEKYSLDGNSVARFLNEAVQPVEDKEDVFKKQIYDAYKLWYISGEGKHPITRKEFYEQVAVFYNKTVDMAFKRNERGIRLVGMEWQRDFYMDYKICDLR